MGLWGWGWAWHGGGAGDTGQPSCLPPAPATVLDTGRGQAEGLPHPAIGCRGGLEGAGKESGPKGLSYPKNAALGEPSQGWTRVDAPFWRREVGKVAKRGARRAADLGGGVRVFDLGKWSEV